MTKKWLDFEFLRERQHILLVLVLVTLHLVSAASPESITGRWLWLVNSGLFLLWQPFVGGDQRIKTGPAVAIFAVVFVLVWQFGWGWLALWHAFLAALVGGKVVMARGARHRWFYLFAFSYLVGAMLVWVSPNILPPPGTLDASFRPIVHIAAILLLIATLIALPRGEDSRPAELHDFLASLLILLLLAVLLLGTIALMALRKTGYYEALVLTLLGAGGSLLLLNWAWNPKPGYGGLGASLSGYLLRIGLDFDRWLKHQIDLAENEEDAARFLERSLEAFSDLPWVAGGEWQACGKNGRFGESARHVTAFAYEGVEVRLFTPYAWTASLVWQASLLLKLVVELHDAKARELRLRQMEYVQAVHETGARLTHDIKNILQSLEALCYAAEHSPDNDSARLADLIRRQLPALRQRLGVTLDKLQRPQDRGEVAKPLAEWWIALKQRNAHRRVIFIEPIPEPALPVPGFMFDSVIDNLLLNAAYKQQSASQVVVSVKIEPDPRGGVVVSVTDDGEAIAADLADRLFSAPLPSATGLGIGLYQAARQARELGYQLRLAENRNGAVRFELSAQN